MAVSKKLNHASGLKELDAMLDSLVDPKFRARALRSAGRKAMKPVQEALKDKIPAGTSDKDSYEHYQGSSKKKGYTSGDLREGVKIKMVVNTTKTIKTNSDGYAKDPMKAEMFANVTFDNHVYKLASILENGRQRRVATTKDGKVFHAWGNPTDDVQRDIGEFKGKNFVAETFAEQESQIVSRFKDELTKSIAQQVKKMEKANAGK
ncbi:HK97 gp10 family phage protein [Vibrio parahaemolyticus]|uniref:HK97 gp10 family phage protein n=1 Tax=Vibrio parahaemolyticus TaxID=670 RepID=UPI0005F1EA6D|nr:HK97 gp10 family phage protein [Vibrio parahaemolyticus]KJR15240.1 hypothetical protein UF28_16370 [Vibrio parahaemolyticus]